MAVFSVRNFYLFVYMLSVGRDAAWELENDAFSDLLERHSRCDVEDCRCPDGRDTNLLDRLFYWLLDWFHWLIELKDVAGDAVTDILSWLVVQCAHTLVALKLNSCYGRGLDILKHISLQECRNVSSCVELHLLGQINALFLIRLGFY